MKYISYLGIHYERLQTEIGRLISTIAFPGNENPTFNYMNIYRVFKNKEGNYTITKNVENTLFTKSPGELNMGELELIILRDLMKNPWAKAPAQYIHRVMSLEGSISFLTDESKKANNNGDTDSYEKFLVSIELHQEDLFELGNQPKEVYELHDGTYDLVEFTKNVRPTRWALIQELIAKVNTKPGYEDWPIYLENLLCMNNMEHRDEEDSSICLYEREIELFSKLFDIL